MPQDKTIVLDYTSRDYSSIRSMLVGLARGFMPEWQTVGESGDFGTLLLELMAYSSDVMNYYVDRVSAEAFLGTAYRRQSVLFIADMLGYTPVGQQAASVPLQLRLEWEGITLPLTTSITVPAGTRVFTTADAQGRSFEFTLDQTVIFGPDSAIGGETIAGTAYTFSLANATATEGTMVGVSTPALLATSKGHPNAEFQLETAGVVFRSLDLFTDEGGKIIHWNRTSRLIDAGPLDSVFAVYVDDNDFTHVVFGDNSAGRIPPMNAGIYITYRYGQGSAANDLSVNLVNNIDFIPTYPIPISLTVTNIAPPTGGADVESVESIKFAVPKANRIKQRAVTLDDFRAIALQVPGIKKAVAYGQLYSTVYVRCAYGASADMLTSEKYVADVERFFIDKTLVGTTVYAEAPEWNNLYVNVNVSVNPLYNREQVRQNVAVEIENLLAFDNVDFGQTISVGDLYRAALSIPGVDFITVNNFQSITYGTVNPTTPYAGQLFAKIDKQIVDTPNSWKLLDSKVTIQTDTAHTYEVGHWALVNNVNAQIDGLYQISEVPDSTHFCYMLPTAGVSVAAGAYQTTATPANTSIYAYNTSGDFVSVLYYWDGSVWRNVFTFYAATYFDGITWQTGGPGNNIYAQPYGAVIIPPVVVPPALRVQDVSTAVLGTDYSVRLPRIRPIDSLINGYTTTGDYIGLIVTASGGLANT
jgi:hypothetical protein